MNKVLAISDINQFIHFDYNSLIINNTFFSYFINPAVPIISVALYLLLSKILFSRIRVLFGLQPKGIILQRLTAIHSLILAVYSLWTCLYSVPIVVRFIAKYGFWQTLCDSEHLLWNEYNFGFWITHFYISKYYEFVDTWIVLLKGKNPIFLQTFHHAGIAILMWGFVVTANTVGLVIVCFNSFIHTLMYTYYAFAALGYQSPLKHYLTQAQIIQFLLGMAITIPTQFFRDCLNPAQALVLGVTQAYTIILICLFVAFYLDNYYAKKRRARKTE